MRIELTRTDGNKPILVNMDRVDYVVPNGSDPDKAESVIYFSSDRLTSVKESYTEIQSRISKKEAIRNMACKH